MRAISAAWSPPLATDTAATARPLAADASEIPAIGPDVVHTDPESRPVSAVASPAPLSRTSKPVSPVSPVIDATATPAHAIGREGAMPGIPVSRYTIWYPPRGAAGTHPTEFAAGRTEK